MFNFSGFIQENGELIQNEKSFCQLHLRLSKVQTPGKASQTQQNLSWEIDMPISYFLSPCISPFQCLTTYVM